MILTQIILELLLKSTVHRFLLVLANTGTSNDYLINFRSLKKQVCTLILVSRVLLFNYSTT